MSQHVRLFAGTRADGQPAYEVIPVVHLGDDVHEVAGSPALADGCAAGDRIRVAEDGSYQVVERGGNLCVVVVPSRPSPVAELRAAFEALGGVVEWPEDQRFVVVTVPVVAGFPAVEGVVTRWAERYGANWWFGNVYDDNDQPLGWWA